MEKIKTLLKHQFGITATQLKPQVGYDSTNIRITAGDDQQYMLKLHQAEPGLMDTLTGEHAVLELLSAHFPKRFPSPISNIKGQSIFQPKDQDYEAGRLLSFLEGSFLAEVPHTPELFQSFGRFLAEMDQQLLNFRHPAIAARHYYWDMQHSLENVPFTRFVADARKRNWVEYFFLQFRTQVSPILPELRKSIIHSDANDWNVLTDGKKVSAIIDFGDMVYTPLISELAIAMAYAILGKDDPIKWACYILEGYHKILPVTAKETDLLYYLIAARWSVSVCHSARNYSLHPENDYYLIHAQPSWEMLEKWLSISPIAVSNAFRKILEEETHAIISIPKILESRHKHISRALKASYESPIMMEGAAFQYMYDTTGHVYLDAYNNIPHVGHAHPKVVSAGQRQMAFLNTNTRYLYKALPAYAEKMLAYFPPKLNKVFFVNSGSEANDLALRMAMRYTGNQQMVVMEHAYHGITRLGINVSPYKFEGKGGDGQVDFISKLPMPDLLRYRGGDHAGEALQIIRKQESIAAFICEPVLGCGGQMPLPVDYLKAVYPEVKKKGGLCIVDEVQTGFGRLGTHFWGFETQEVVPDIVVLGKPMGNGHPLAAVITTDEIADAFDNGMEFFSSFGGNTVSCVIGQAVLDVLEEENLQMHALETGKYLKGELLKLQDKYEVIADVRGSGFFLGIEFVKNGESLEPNSVLAQKVKEELRKQFILMGTDGPFNQVLKIKPPMCFGRANATEFIEKLDMALSVF